MRDRGGYGGGYERERGGGYDRGYGGGGGGHERSRGYGGPSGDPFDVLERSRSKGSAYRAIVKGLPASASWQDLKVRIAKSAPSSRHLSVAPQAED